MISMSKVVNMSPTYLKNYRKVAVYLDVWSFSLRQKLWQKTLFLVALPGNKKIRAKAPANVFLQGIPKKKTCSKFYLQASIL